MKEPSILTLIAILLGKNQSRNGDNQVYSNKRSAANLLIKGLTKVQHYYLSSKPGLQNIFSQLA